ncbi:hypothetical protein GCM10022226_44500 [Sphaerisporangium flaviroseum]|uniref:Peptidoglycan binding-like domain-containing protein n=1 Tax=Sphaerisporangium flaviroseum TaxID=509199 RepID=A0ABP7II36_9ACTN
MPAPARRTLIKSTLFVTAASAVTLAVAGQHGQAPALASTSTSATVVAADLASCPDLAYGRRDPVNGMNCVRALQLALRRNDYPGQAVTGNFMEHTRANVLDFQRRRGIQPISGIVGPKTRRALLGTSSPDQSTVPPVRPSDYSARRPYCQDTACHFYLRRSSTQKFAQWLEDHPKSGAIVSGTLLAGACAFLKWGPAKFACAILGDIVTDRVGARLRSAAGAGACLRLSIGFPPAKPFTATPDNSGRCSD